MQKLIFVILIKTFTQENKDIEEVWKNNHLVWQSTVAEHLGDTFVIINHYYQVIRLKFTAHTKYENFQLKIASQA